jgi:hypothetical protein
LSFQRFFAGLCAGHEPARIRRRFALCCYCLPARSSGGHLALHACWPSHRRGDAPHASLQAARDAVPFVGLFSVSCQRLAVHIRHRDRAWHDQQALIDSERANCSGHQSSRVREYASLRRPFAAPASCVAAIRSVSQSPVDKRGSLSWNPHTGKHTPALAAGTIVTLTRSR